MKNYKINRIAGNALILAILLSFQSGCTFAFNGVKGDGNVVKQERTIGSFNEIEVGGAFRVFLSQGNEEKLIVEADENLLDIITTEVRGNTLEISTNKDIRNYDALNIYLTFKEIEELDISGACKLSADNKLRFDDLDLECSGASNVELKFSANNLDMDFSGASDVELYGSADKVELEVSGASNLDAFEFETNYFDIDVSGASHAKIFVKEELSAEVSGAASLKYKGSPVITNHDVSGAGSMKKY